MAKYATLLCLLLATSFIALSSQAATLDICRGLALQGGSDKGAYQAGVLQGLFKKLGAEGISYDVVSGVTIGAINAAWISQFPKGQEEPMIDSIINFWLTIKASDVYKNWIGGVVQGLLFESSIYNTEHGEQYLRSHFTQPPQRYVAIGTANANTGAFKVFNNFKETLPVDDFLTAIMASMGIAGVFPYVQIGDSTYFDGSTLKSLDVASVVNQCRALNGGDDSKIIVDIILLSGKTFNNAAVDHPNALKVLIKTLELTSYNNVMTGVIRAKENFPQVQFRYVIQPSSALPNSDMPVSFDRDEIVNMMTLGMADAGAAVDLGEGVSFQQLYEEAVAKQTAKYGGSFNKAMLQDYLSEMNELLKGQNAAN